MKWHKSLAFSEPLKDARIIRPGSPDSREAVEARVALREDAAYGRGLGEGERRLSEQLLRQRTEVLELQNGIFSALHRSVPQVIRDTEAALIELAVEVAQRLVAGLPISVEMVEAAVRSALEQVEESREFEVFLHADDLTLLQSFNSPVLLPGPGYEAIHFHTSNEVTRGGCLVETRFGVIDSRRETKLQLIQQSLAS